MIVSEDSRAQWNEFVASCTHGDVLQCWEWGELKAGTGWEPLHFATCEQGEFAALALVLKRRIPRTRRSLLYCPRGPIWHADHPDALPILLAEIGQAAAQHGAIMLKMDPAIAADDEQAIAQLGRAGALPGPEAAAGFGGTQPRAVMKVDLSPDEDALLASFHSKWRYNIRYAARKGVRVTSECRREDMDAFYDLLQITAARDGFRVRSRSYFHDMWDRLVSRDMGTLLMAYVDDVPVAGALIFVLGEQSWYVYGASANEHRKLMPNHLIQWEAMRWAKSRGCTSYDMRGVSPEVNGEPVVEALSGLNRFKKGFGARYVEYTPDWEIVFSRPWHFAFRHLAPIAQRFLARGREEPED